MFQTKFVEKIKTRTLSSVTFFPQKIYHLWDKVEKYGRTRQATDDNKIRLMRVACWIRYKHTHTLTICNISFFFFYCSHVCKNAPHSYVTRTLPVVLNIHSEIFHIYSPFLTSANDVFQTPRECNGPSRYSVTQRHGILYNCLYSVASQSSCMPGQSMWYSLWILRHWGSSSQSTSVFFCQYHPAECS